MAQREALIKVRANWFAGGRAIGGTLEINPDQARFTPHSLDAALGAKVLKIAAGDVEALERVGRSLTSPRRRLRIRRVDGSDEILLINRLDEVATSAAHILNVAYLE
jgi:hypothetical protein